VTQRIPNLELLAQAQRDFDEGLQALGRLRVVWSDALTILARIEALKTSPRRNPPEP